MSGLKYTQADIEWLEKVVEEGKNSKEVRHLKRAILTIEMLVVAGIVTLLVLR